MAKTAMLAFRVADEMKSELERRAAAEDRSVSNLVERILREWLASASTGPQTGSARASARKAR